MTTRARSNRFIRDSIDRVACPPSPAPERRGDGASSDAERAGRRAHADRLANAWRPPTLDEVIAKARDIATRPHAWRNFTDAERDLAVDAIVRIDVDDRAVVASRSDNYIAIMFLGAIEREEIRNARKVNNK